MIFKKLTAIATILILSMALTTGCSQKPTDTATGTPSQEVPAVPEVQKSKP